MYFAPWCMICGSREKLNIGPITSCLAPAVLSHRPRSFHTRTHFSCLAPAYTSHRQQSLHTRGHDWRLYFAPWIVFMGYYEQYR